MKKLLILFFILITGCKKDTVIFDSDVDESFELPLVLNFNNKNCFFDESSKTFKYSISENDLANFKPLTKFQEYSTIKINNLNLQNNAINDLSNFEIHTVYSLEVITKGEQNNFSVIFTNIPLIRIITADEIKNNSKSLAKITINKPIQQECFNSFISIEIRGKSSASLPKKSYGIKLIEGNYMNKEKTTSVFSNLSSNHKWSLGAMYSDESKIRDQINFKIWESLGYKTIKANYVEVFINNNSHGLYRFSENYTESYLNMTTSSVLYTGFEHSKYTHFREISSTHPNKGVWTDWEQVYPNSSERIEWEDFYSLSKLIIEDSDANFISHIEDHIDTDNLIDYFLFINLFYGKDSVGKNWHFFKLNKTSKFIILPWDLDYSWGRRYDGTPYGYNGIVNNDFFNRFLTLNPNNFKTRLKSKWITLRNSEYSNLTLLSLFEENYNLVKSYKIIESENRIWNTNIDLSLEKIYTDNWLRSRLKFMDDYINNL